MLIIVLNLIFIFFATLVPLFTEEWDKTTFYILNDEEAKIEYALVYQNGSGYMVFEEAIIKDSQLMVDCSKQLIVNDLNNKNIKQCSFDTVKRINNFDY